MSAGLALRLTEGETGRESCAGSEESDADIANMDGYCRVSPIENICFEHVRSQPASITGLLA